MTYPVLPQPKKPDLPGTVLLAPEVEDVITAVAHDMMAQAINCVRTFGDFHLALSGGSTPFPLYRRLMLDPEFRAFPWARTHVWIVDERCVPFDHEKSNWRQIKEIIADHSGIPREQTHPMMVMQEGTTCADDYEKELRHAFLYREKGHDRLDFVILGMGDDGHTASLFPQSPATLDSLRPAPGAPPRWVVMNRGPKVTPPDRCTMTYTLLNAARMLACLCVGDKKQPMLARVARKADEPADLPILGIAPVAGELRWYLDHAACPR
ncbi:MAG: 6-phosphogluconolactonase [Phycisphaerales bacterium]